MCADHRAIALGPDEALAVLVLVVLLELVPERARERPEQEERADDQHRDPDGEVEVPPRRLLDLLVRGVQSQDHQDDAVDDEQPADHAAEVEEVGRAARLARVDLGVLGLGDEWIVRHVRFLPTQMKARLRATTSPSAPAASSPGLRYQTFSSAGSFSSTLAMP